MSSSSVRAQEVVAILLRGVGQVMFQGHAGTGLLFLAGIGVASPLMLLGALLGATIGPLTAFLASFDRAELEQGIYGFNSTLVGVATIVFLQPGFAITWISLVIGCIAASVVTYLSRRYLKFPTYTAPFVVVTWIILLAAHSITGKEIDVPPAVAKVVDGGFISEVLRGEAEVMFGAGDMTGALFLAGIAVSSLWHAGLAVLGSLVGTSVALYHGDPEQLLAIGIYGYNGALAAMALFLTRRTLTLPILAAILATLFTEFFPKSLGLPALTAPFVAASWCVLLVIWIENRLFPAPRSPE